MAGDRRLRVGDSSATSLPTIATQSNSVCRGLLGPQPLFGSPHGDPSVTGTRMASDVGQSLPHNAQNLRTCFVVAVGEHILLLALALGVPPWRSVAEAGGYRAIHEEAHADPHLTGCLATWWQRSCRFSAPPPDSGSALSCGRSGCIPPTRGTSILAVEFWFVAPTATSHQLHRCTRHKTLSILCDKTISGQRVVTGLCAI
jgi:hypothetical protein